MKNKTPSLGLTAFFLCIALGLFAANEAPKPAVPPPAAAAHASTPADGKTEEKKPTVEELQKQVEQLTAQLERQVAVSRVLTQQRDNLASQLLNAQAAMQIPAAKP